MYWIYERNLEKLYIYLYIQFSINSQFSYIWAIDRTLPGTNTPGKSGPASDGNKEILPIAQSSSIPGASS